MSEFDEILLEITDLDIDAIIYNQNPIELNYKKLKRDLSAIKDKNTIQCINRSNCLLNTLEENTFNGFYNLIELDFSYNILTCLPKGVFDQLLNLKTINLSHNLIFELKDFVFSNNKQLETINLSNNLLSEINRNVFKNLPTLRTLDISYNKIERLTEKCISLKSLQDLNLSYNLIMHINEIALWSAPNLIQLQLKNNKISYLTEIMFKNVTKIEILNFSNNLIRRLHVKTLANLNNLKQVDFSNNLLESCGNCFKKKPVLEELNLLHNPIVKYRKRDFVLSKSIRKLKLTIFYPQKLKRLKNLKLLSDFELHVKTDEIFHIQQLVFSNINESTIQRLYTVILRGKFNVSNEIRNLFNLEFLHIEFLEPNNYVTIFDIWPHIKMMPKLKHLALININKLIIKYNEFIIQSKLNYLDLTGIDNETVDFLENNFILLEHLNLSASKVKFISSDLMKTLPYLKSLNMNDTRISIIRDNLFQYNYRLEFIYFRDCQIHTIEENSFHHLENLKQIDIRGNKLLKITQGLLNGIPKSAVVFYD